MQNNWPSCKIGMTQMFVAAMHDLFLGTTTFAIMSGPGEYSATYFSILHGTALDSIY